MVKCHYRSWREALLTYQIMLFKKHRIKKSYDSSTQKPVIKCSICNGEQVVGFKDIHTGAFEEVMLIRNEADLDAFRKEYGIAGDIGKIY